MLKATYYACTLPDEECEVDKAEMEQAHPASGQVM